MAVKMAYRTCFGKRTTENVFFIFYFIILFFFGGPYYKRKAPFYKKISGNSLRNGVFARRPGAFYFWPLYLFLASRSPALVCYFVILRCHLRGWPGGVPGAYFDSKTHQKKIPKAPWELGWWRCRHGCPP